MTIHERVRCGGCDNEILLDDFAGIHRGIIYCDSLACLIKMDDEIEKSLHEDIKEKKK